MNRVFADTLYWIVITRPGDPRDAAARRAAAAGGRRAQIVTTDEARSIHGPSNSTESVTATDVNRGCVGETLRGIRGQSFIRH